MSFIVKKKIQESNRSKTPAMFNREDPGGLSQSNSKKPDFYAHENIYRGRTW